MSRSPESRSVIEVFDSPSPERCSQDIFEMCAEPASCSADDAERDPANHDHATRYGAPVPPAPERRFDLKVYKGEGHQCCEPYLGEGPCYSTAH